MSDHWQEVPLSAPPEWVATFYSADGRLRAQGRYSAEPPLDDEWIAEIRQKQEAEMRSAGYVPFSELAQEVREMLRPPTEHP